MPRLADWDPTLRRSPARDWDTWRVQRRRARFATGALYSFRTRLACLRSDPESQEKSLVQFSGPPGLFPSFEDPSKPSSSLCPCYMTEACPDMTLKDKGSGPLRQVVSVYALGIFSFNPLT